MRKIGFFTLLVLICSCCTTRTPQDKLTIHDKEIDAIIAQMSLEEKVEMFHSKTIMSSEGVPRLGIQDVKYADGPFGIREELGDGFRPLGWELDYATYFPTGSALASTWDEDIAYKYGTGMGREARLRGKDIILGPAINIQRLPVGGRSYEYLSEDPFLSSRLTVAYTKGVQDQGTAVCLKHFALNNQETNRESVNVIVDERTMREIYLPPFEAAVKEAGAMSVMSAYNKVNGYYCSENEHLLNEILRGEWGFKGMIISDWGGTHSTMGAALHGLNVQMTGDDYLGPALIDSVKAGKVPMEVIDAKARDILRVRYAIEAIPNEKANIVMTSQAEQQKIAYEVAQKSIVLLKNNQDILPLNKDIKRIAVIGQNAVLSTAAGGVGAGVKVLYEINPLQGITERAKADNIEIVYAPGYKNYAFNTWGPPSKDPLVAKSIDEALDPELLNEALSAAKNADVVLFFCGTNKTIETEGSDRNDIKLPCNQEKLAEELAAVNPNLVSIIVSGGPCDLREIEGLSPAMIQAWWNGMEGGKALAEILFGDISPSGKLPFTFPLKLEDSPAYAMGNFPNLNFEDDLFTLMYREDKTVLSAEERSRRITALSDPESRYTEGILVGYRWFDTKNVPVMYAFGHGLSYANFAYSSLKAKNSKNAISLSFEIENQGDMNCDEVAQVYVRWKDSKIERADKELKAFKRITINKGKTQKINLSIPYDNLRYWDNETNSWVLEKARLEILVGSASDDIRLRTEIDL